MYDDLDARGPVEPLRVHLTGADIPMFDQPAPGLRRSGISLYSITLTANDPIQPLLPLNARRCKAWILPSSVDITIATDPSELQSGGNGTVTIPAAGDGNSVSNTGTATGTNTGTAGLAIATIPASSLPAGRYRIDVYSQMPTIANGSTSNAVQVQAGSTAIATLINHIVAQNSGAYTPKQPLTLYRYLDGLTALSANFIANLAATETQTWSVTLVATPQGAPVAAPVPLPTTDPVWATAAQLPTRVSVAAIIQEP